MRVPMSRTTSLSLPKRPGGRRSRVPASGAGGTPLRAAGRVDTRPHERNMYPRAPGVNPRTRRSASAGGPERGPAGIDRAGAQLLLDPEQLVVLRHAVG